MYIVEIYLKVGGALLLNNQSEDDVLDIINDLPVAKVLDVAFNGTDRAYIPVDNVSYIQTILEEDDAATSDSSEGSE